MRIWVLLPLSRPLGDLACKNYLSQEHEDKRLCVIETGSGVGEMERVGLHPDLLLRAEGGPGAVRNVALQALRGEAADYVVCMDDDDVYLPGYLSEHSRHAQPGRIVGKLPHWVDFGDGKARLFERENSERRGFWGRGGTLGFHLSEVGDFPDLSVGEDVEFCRDFLAAGGEIYNSSVAHVIYNRHPNPHAYSVPPRVFACNHGLWFEEHVWDEALFSAQNPPEGPRKTWNTLP